jgi:hypothetical protein
MTTIGDLVKHNPLYQQDTGYYKHYIPESRFTEIIDPSSLKKASIQQICIEVAQKVTLIALVIIPSIYISGGAILGGILLGSIVGVIATRAKDEELEGGKFNIFNRIKWKAELLAALPKQQIYKDIFIRQLGIDAIIKAAFLGTVLLVPASAASIISPIGLYFAFYSVVKEVDRLVLNAIENHAKKHVEAKYKATLVTA